MSNHKPHNEAQGLWQLLAISLRGLLWILLNCLFPASSSSRFRSTWKRSGPPHQEKEKPSSQMPATQTLCVRGRVLLSVPRMVIADRKRSALCYMHSPRRGLIVAFPQNLLKEVKSTLNAGILSCFVHVLKEDISCLPSTTSSQVSLCLASLRSPSTCLNRLHKIQPGQEISMKMPLQAHT